jgi:hypothetical protein
MRRHNDELRKTAVLADLRFLAGRMVTAPPRAARPWLTRLAQAVART